MIQAASLNTPHSAKAEIEGELSGAPAGRSRSPRHDCQAMGARLRRTRQERGLTLGDVARALGVTTACVCQWEAGKSYPKPHFWSELARAVGTSVSFLIVGEEEIARPAIVPPLDVLQRARREIATAFGLEVSRVRIEVDQDPAQPIDP